jgi:hypothetical protein
MAPEAMRSAVIGDSHDPQGARFIGAASVNRERRRKSNEPYIERILPFDPILHKIHTDQQGAALQPGKGKSLYKPKSLGVQRTQSFGGG